VENFGMDGLTGTRIW